MKLKDQQAIKLLKKVRSNELEEMIDTYPEDEIDGRTDLEMLMNELSYYYSCYFEDGHCFKDDLDESKRKLRETKNGKVIPLNPKTLKPQYGYWPSDIQSCKDLLNEVARLKRLGEKLQTMGYYGRWWTF